MTNGNDTPKFGFSREQVDALFARSNEQAAADREARQRAVEWPTVIEKALVRLFGSTATHDDALAAIDARIAKLEAAAAKKA